MNIAKRTFNPLLGNSFRFVQSENADLNYTGNWGATIQPDTIATSTWTVESGDATISNESNTTTTTEAMFTGDTGESVITNKIVTAGGETDERKILLKISANDIPYYNNDYGRC